MTNLALDLTLREDDQRVPQQNNVVSLLKGNSGERFVFCRGQLLSSYDQGDLYARNYLIVQLFLCHRVSQKRYPLQTHWERK